MAHQYMPKIFNGAHRNPPPRPPSFILNVRSLKGLRFRKRFTLIYGKLQKWYGAASLYQKQFYLLTKVNYWSIARLNTSTFLFKFLSLIFLFLCQVLAWVIALMTALFILLVLTWKKSKISCVLILMQLRGGFKKITWLVMPRNVI